MYSNYVDFDILVNDKPIKKHDHSTGTWIEGWKGSEYKLKIKNKSYARILVIPSVDGLSVLDGKEASENSRGYVLNSKEEIIIPGWTLDNENVAKFTFSDKEKSYVAASGNNKQNIGVIGLMIFTEKYNHNGMHDLLYRKDISWYPADIKPRYGTPTFPEYNNIPFYSTLETKGLIAGSLTNTVQLNQNYMQLTASASVASEPDLGTEFGKVEEFKTIEMNFEKAANIPNEILSIFYASKKYLTDNGIIVQEKPKPKKPNPFPGLGCKPPANWKWE